jgi:hypothetical protein
MENKEQVIKQFEDAIHFAYLQGFSRSETSVAFLDAMKSITDKRNAETARILYGAKA